MTAEDTLARRAEGIVRYAAELDGEPALLEVNSSLRPDSRLRLLWVARLALEQPPPDQLICETDEPRLSAAAAEFSELIEGRARYAGRSLVPGSCTFFAYSASEPPLEGKQSSLQLTVKDDRNWEHFQKVLYPNSLAWAYIDTMQIRHLLREKGDDHDLVRRINHSAVFKMKGEAERFGKWIATQEYALEGVDRGEGKSWEVTFSEERNLSLPEIHDHVYRSVRLTEEFGGRYDGWGCMVTHGRGG